jgi:formylmethanofuran dehydrogenase subunit E
MEEKIKLLERANLHSPHNVSVKQIMQVHKRLNHLVRCEGCGIYIDDEWNNKKPKTSTCLICERGDKK